VEGLNHVRCCGLLLALLLSLPAQAQGDEWDGADPEARAKELYQNGALLYEEGRYEDAIVAWEEAYRLSERPALLFNIANAQERVGRWREALDTLNRYRAYANASQREQLDRRIANLERRLRDQGDAPDPVGVGNSGANTSGGNTASGGGGAPVLPLVLMGGGALLTGAGGVFAFRAVGARGAAASGCTQASGGTWCLDLVGDELQRDRSSSLVADLGFVLGGAALATGAVLFVLDLDGAPAVGVRPGGLVIQGQF